MGGVWPVGGDILESGEAPNISGLGQGKRIYAWEEAWPLLGRCFRERADVVGDSSVVEPEAVVGGRIGTWRERWEDYPWELEGNCLRSKRGWPRVWEP